jgi:hypothetical protein
MNWWRDGYQVQRRTWVEGPSLTWFVVAAPLIFGFRFISIALLAFSFWSPLTLGSYGYIFFYAWILRLAPPGLPVAAPVWVQVGGRRQPQRRQERPGQRRVAGQGLCIYDHVDPYDLWWSTRSYTRCCTARIRGTGSTRGCSRWSGKSAWSCRRSGGCP